MVLQRWKKAQQEKRFKRQKKSIFSFLILIITLLILASSFRFYSGWKKSKIRGLNRVSFIISSEEVSIVSLVEGREIVSVDLPEEQKIRLTRGFGDYPISAIFKLGELEKKGLPLLVETFQEYFAIPIEGAISPKTPYQCGQTRKFCLENILLDSLRGKAKTDFSFQDLFFLWWQLRRTSEFTLKNLLIEDLDQKKLDPLIARNFADNKVSEENLTIAVYNSTGFTGLGNQGARIVTNLGGRVISLGGSDFKKESLVISSKKAANSYTVKLLKKIFQAKLEEGETEGGRADIGIYLGADYWKKLNEKW